MSGQPVFFTRKTNRNKQFLLETRIWKDGSGLWSEKRAASPASAKHLERMLQTHQKLSQNTELQRLMHIVAAQKLSDGSIRFEWIDGVSSERLLLEHVVANRQAEALALIDKLFRIMDCLPGNEAKPVDNLGYVKIFGKSFGSRQPCIAPGLLDLNLDNIMVSKDGSWHLFDYEWSFDFPLPKKLLRVRILWFFLYRHREILRYFSNSVDMVVLGDSLIIPAFMFEAYADDFKNLASFAKAELNFQLYVSGSQDTTFAKLAANNPEDAKPFKEPVLGIDAIYRSRDRAREELQNARTELERARALNDSLTEQLGAIRRSRSYRLAQKLAKAVAPARKIGRQKS